MIALADGVRRVASPAGEAEYGEPIGTPITAKLLEKVGRRPGVSKPIGKPRVPGRPNMKSGAFSGTIAARKQAGNPNPLSVAAPKPVVKETGNKATRADDKRTGQGQTRTNFVNEITNAPMGKTESGDTFEQLFISKGKSLVEGRYGKFELVTSAGAGGSRTTPLDLRTRSHGGELKTMSSLSKNLKTAIKKDEIDRKLHAVATEKLKPLLLVQVVDQKTHTVNLYGMEMFGSKAVSSMEHYGEFKYSKSDFKKAQEKSGHAAKASDRAIKQLTPQAREKYDKLVKAGDTSEAALAKIKDDKSYVALSVQGFNLLESGILTLQAWDMLQESAKA